MATFWERAAHSVDHIFSLYFNFLIFVVVVISHFGFEGWIWVMIASVPGFCTLFTCLSIQVCRPGGCLVSTGLVKTTGKAKS